MTWRMKFGACSRKSSFSALLGHEPEAGLEMQLSHRHWERVIGCRCKQFCVTISRDSMKNSVVLGC